MCSYRTVPRHLQEGVLRGVRGLARAKEMNMLVDACQTPCPPSMTLPLCCGDREAWVCTEAPRGSVRSTENIHEQIRISHNPNH